MSANPWRDELGRQSISEAMKQQIDTELAGLEGRAALIVIGDTYGTRAHLAAKLPHGWKVAAGAGFQWGEQKPAGFVVVQKVW